MLDNNFQITGCVGSRARLDAVFFLGADRGAKGRLIIIWVSSEVFNAAATCINIYY